jgi:hypothetical protein
MTKDEALKLALEALEEYHYGEARIILRQALEQPEERNFCPRCGKRTADLTTIHTCTPPQPEQDFKAVPKEHAPLVKWAKEQKPWVGLTQEERLEIRKRKWWDWEDAFDIDGFMQAIEKRLKEKNT